MQKQNKIKYKLHAFMAAKEHGAYSYVTLPNDNKTYTIEEFQSMFIMN